MFRSRLSDNIPVPPEGTEGWHELVSRKASLRAFSGEDGPVLYSGDSPYLLGKW